MEYLAAFMKTNQVRYIVFLFCSHPMWHSLQTITSLDVSYNEISDVGAQLLATALKVNQVRELPVMFFSNYTVTSGIDTHNTEPPRL